MVIEDIVKISGNSLEISRNTKLVKEYFESILNKEVIVKLRILDPRVNHYSIYGNFSKEDFGIIKKYYPEAKIKRKILNPIELTESGRIGFTMYTAEIDEIQALIELHDSQHALRELEDAENNVLY